MLFSSKTNDLPSASETMEIVIFPINQTINTQPDPTYPHHKYLALHPDRYILYADKLISTNH
jgi:hypothetical protein